MSMQGNEPEEFRAWVRVVNEILRRLEDGDLKPGARIPAIGTLVSELGMSRPTVAGAYRYLAAEKIIRPNPAGYNAGYLVCSDPRYTYPACPAGPRPETARSAGGESLSGRFGGAGDTRMWIRVANTTLDRISSGQYTGRLPSRAELAAEFGISRRMVTKACMALESRGLITRSPGHPYAVRRVPGAPPALEEDQQPAVLDWLKGRHGGDWDIGVAWSARSRTGDGQVITAGTGSDLDAALSTGLPQPEEGTSQS